MDNLDKLKNIVALIELEHSKLYQHGVKTSSVKLRHHLMDICKHSKEYRKDVLKKRKSMPTKARLQRQDSSKHDNNILVTDTDALVGA